MLHGIRYDVTPISSVLRNMIRKQVTVLIFLYMKHKHVICRASFKKNPKMYIFSKLKLYLKNYAGGHKM